MDFTQDAVDQPPKGFEFGQTAGVGKPGRWIIQADGTNKVLAQADPDSTRSQQIIAEVGATAATFPSPKHLASWMGACPGNEESAGVNYSHRCPKGNRQMRASSIKPPTPR